MKVLVVHNFYSSKSIGGEDIVFRNEVMALCDELGESNVFQYSVSNDDLSLIGLIFLIWWSPLHYFRIKKMVKLHSIDIVHVHNFFPILTPAIFLAAKRAGAKVVQTLHNFRWWCVAGTFFRNNSNSICEICSKGYLHPFYGIKNKCFRNSYIQSLMAVMAFLFYKLLMPFRFIDIFIALTPFQQQKLIKLGIPKEKILLKPNFVDTSYSPSCEKKEYDFIFVGRIEPCKGIDSLIEVIESPGFNYTIRVIGSSNDSSVLNKLLNNSKIIYSSSLSRRHVLKEISKSRYFLHLSKCFETFGLTIVEAFSQGVPVIGYPIGTRNDFIRGGENGFLIDESLAKTMEMAVNSNEYSALQAGALRCSESFTLSEVVRMQMELYQTLID